MRHAEADLTAPEFELSAPEAARVLGVSLATIYRWSDLGHLPSRQTASGQRRFGRAQLDGFISALKRQHVDLVNDRRTG